MSAVDEFAGLITEQADPALGGLDTWPTDRLVGATNAKLRPRA